MTIHFFLSIIILLSSINFLRPVIQIVDTPAPPPTIVAVITPEQSSALVGQKIPMLVKIAIRPEDEVQNVKIIPFADSSTWRLLESETQLLIINPNQALFKIYMVPFKEGSLFPNILIQYQSQNKTYSELAVSQQSILVQSAASLIKARIFISTGSKPSDPIQAGVRVTNSSPFTLAQLSITGQGYGLSWRGNASLPAVAPYATSELAPLTADVKQAPSVAQAQIVLKFKDDSGGTQELWINTDSQQISTPLTVSGFTTLVNSMPPGLFGAIAGVFATLVGGLIVQILGDLYSRGQKRKSYIRQIKSLLNMSVMETLSAAPALNKIDLDPVNQVLNQGELHTVLISLKINSSRLNFWQKAYARLTGKEFAPDCKLGDLVYGFWTDARAYNDTRNSDSGYSRGQIVMKRAKSLQQILDAVG